MEKKRLSSPMSSAAVIGGNDDLLLEILILLPAKSLLRFKLVSKHWRSLISDESFHNLHCRNRHRRRPQPQFILRTTASLQLFICDLAAKTLAPLPFKHRHVKVLQSSHGLLLLDCRKSPRSYKDICVYNPATAQCRKLLTLDGEDHSRFCLMCDDPSKSHHYRVFNFITNNRDFGYTGIKVYDSRTQQWQCRGKFVQRLQRFPDGVLCNDCLYFIRYTQPSLRFSPDDAISAVANPPRGRPSRRRKKYVIESNGYLHCLMLSLMAKKCVLDVYEMTDDTCWLTRPLSATFVVGSIEEIEVLGFMRGEREEDSMLVYHVPGKIMVYRFGDGVSEEIVNFSRESYYQKGFLQFEFKESHHFVETLAPV